MSTSQQDPTGYHTLNDTQRRNSRRKINNAAKVSEQTEASHKHHVKTAKRYSKRLRHLTVAERYTPERELSLRANLLYHLRKASNIREKRVEEDSVTKTMTYEQARIEMIQRGPISKVQAN
jgi:hypothetical protein